MSAARLGRNMPPARRSPFWDGEVFTLCEAPSHQADAFAPIASDLAAMVMQLDGDVATQLSAVASLKALLWASNLSLRDLADRIKGEGAVPRRLMN